MSIIGFGSYQPDIASVGTSDTSYVNNVVPRADGYGPFKDIASITQALNERCLGFISVLDETGNSHFFAGTSTKLYKLNATSRVFEDVTRTSGGNYAVGSREFWSFEIFGTSVIAVSDNNAPQRYILNSSTKFANLAGSPPMARFVSVVGDFLVLSGLTANPRRVHWSGINNIIQWTPGLESCDFQDFPSGGNAIKVVGGEFGFVLQDSSIRRMIFNPGPTIFDFSAVSEDRGVRMPYSIIKAQSAVFFFGSDGFYKLNPSGEMVPIGANRVNDTINADLDQTNYRFMLGSIDPLNKRVVWAYKSVGNTNPRVLDKGIMYDWSLDRWAPFERPMDFIGIATPIATTLESLDSLGSLDSLPFSLDTYVNTPKFQLCGVGIDHAAGFFSGSALEATLDTPEGAIGNGVRVSVRQAAPVTDATTAYVKVAHRERVGDAVAYSIEQPVNYRGYAPQRVSGRYNTGRLRIPAATAWTFARGLDVEASTMGKR